MRRALNIAFTVVYLTLSVGLTVVVHFCGTDVESFGLAPLTSTQTSCCCGVEEDYSPCCATQTTVLRLTDEHLTAVTPACDLQFAGTPVEIPAGNQQFSGRPVVRAFCATSPSGQPPLTILYCTFLI